MEKQLNKSILITGCSTGIGAALVTEFLKTRLSCVWIDKRQKNGSASKEEIW